MVTLVSLSDTFRAHWRRALRRAGFLRRRPTILVQFPPYALK